MAGGMRCGTQRSVLAFPGRQQASRRPENLRKKDGVPSKQHAGSPESTLLSVNSCQRTNEVDAAKVGAEACPWSRRQP